MKRVAAFFTLFVCFVSICGQDFRTGVVTAFSTRDYRAAAAMLDELRNTDRARYEANNYDYLRGRVAERLGDSATAAAAYVGVVNRRSELRQCALRRLAVIARASGNLLLERTYLLELQVVAPDALTADAVRIRLARSFFESASFDDAIAAFATLRNSSLNNSAAAKSQVAPEKTARFREIQMYLAEAMMQRGRVQEARELFQNLITNLPNPSQPDDFALAGVRGLDRFDTGEAFGREVGKLTDFSHLQRATIYQFNREFADARRHFQAIIKNHPQSGLVADAMFQIGRGFAQERNFADAIVWFERLREQFPAHPAARDALTQAASAYARVNQPKEAITRYQQFIAAYPDAENLDRAYLNLIDVARDMGDDSEALKWAATTRDVFRGKPAEALALFAQLRIRVAGADWANALADADQLLALSDLGGTRVPGGTNRAEVIFLKALALENLRRFPEAVATYLSLPDGRNEYYGWRATERLRELFKLDGASVAVRERLQAAEREFSGGTPDSQRIALQTAIRLNPEPAARRTYLEALRRVYQQIPDYGKLPAFRLIDAGRRTERTSAPPSNLVITPQILADELLFLGLFDEATPEFERALASRQTPIAGDVAFTLAEFYRRGDIGHRATLFAEPLWKNIPADFQPELIPREHAQLLFPAPYADALLAHAPPRSVDPRFVLSVMRQESRFRADVKSNAAARGSMQFISTTARQIADDLKLTNFRQDDLYDPNTAVLFGAEYLAKIYKQFPSGDAAVAASYNGGEDNVARWIVRSRSDSPDRYVAEIVFSQSKDYAYKVMANYRVYRLFYDDQLRAIE